MLAYACGDAAIDFIQPFRAIPILTVTRLKFGGVLDYTGIVAVVRVAISVIAMLVSPTKPVAPPIFSSQALITGRSSVSSL